MGPVADINAIFDAVKAMRTVLIGKGSIMPIVVPVLVPIQDRLPAVEAAGQALYDARAAFMVETNQGLTKTYNALKDPANEDPRVLHLRELHQAMDRAVTGAYGWTDLDVPPYCPLDDEAKAKVKAFEDAVVDRLFALNAERAKAEAGAVRGKGGAEKGAKAKKKKGGPMLPGMG